MCVCVGGGEGECSFCVENARKYEYPQEFEMATGGDDILVGRGILALEDPGGDPQPEKSRLPHV